MKKSAPPKEQRYEVRPGQSLELLKELHILTRDGQMNQDSRRKLKQIYHLMQFIEPLLDELRQQRPQLDIVDHGAGKSYLGFIVHDLYIRPHAAGSRIHGIERRAELVERSQTLAQRLGFADMHFHALSVADSITSTTLPERPDMVTALHACDTATDDAIDFALKKQAHAIVLVPCCQAEVAATLRQKKAAALARGSLSELWRHPLHTREFGSHVTNVLRCLQLEAHGYQVSVTELVGWEHSLKNELIIAKRSHDHSRPRKATTQRLQEMLKMLGLEELKTRFYVPGG